MSRMTTESPDVQIGGEISSMKIQKEIFIEAPIDIAFECVLAQLGPESQMPDGRPFPFKLEAFPGGRWLRDLGNNTGHLWGHVQVIKPPKLIELWGPFMMSYAATNHAQYRRTACRARQATQTARPADRSGRPLARNAPTPRPSNLNREFNLDRGLSRADGGRRRNCQRRAIANP